MALESPVPNLCPLLWIFHIIIITEIGAVADRYKRQAVPVIKPDPYAGKTIGYYVGNTVTFTDGCMPVLRTHELCNKRKFLHTKTRLSS